MKVLFISHSKQGPRYFNDPSARYRCIGSSEWIAHARERSDVLHIEQVTKATVADYDIVVFHRPSDSPKFRSILKVARSFGAKIFTDFDDLIFAPNESQYSASVLAGGMSGKLAYSIAQNYQSALNAVDECIVSTEPLAKWVKSVSSVNKVHVIPNHLPERWYYQTKPVDVALRFEGSLLRYLPGTSHHDGDFDFIKSVLTAFLNKHTDVTLEVIGPLRFELEGVNASQVRHKKGVPFDELAQYMADSWVCIAPLAETVFNQCKSGLKFWESGLYGIPLVASPLSDFDRFECGGLFQVTTHSQWIEALENLLIWKNYKTASDEARLSAQRAIQSRDSNPYLDLFSDETVDVDQTTPAENTAVPQLPEQTSGELDSGITTFYRIQQQYFYAWFGVGWKAYLLKPVQGLTQREMPGEAASRESQLTMLIALQEGRHWASKIAGNWVGGESLDVGIGIYDTPPLPESYAPFMKSEYSSWIYWLRDVSVANKALWKVQQTPAGSPFMRKWRKFRRSPKHFFEDSKSPFFKSLARFF